MKVRKGGKDGKESSTRRTLLFLNHVELQDKLGLKDTTKGNYSLCIEVETLHQIEIGYNIAIGAY